MQHEKNCNAFVIQINETNNTTFEIFRAICFAVATNLLPKNLQFVNVSLDKLLTFLVVKQTRAVPAFKNLREVAKIVT